ncbi:uncharacterized protein I303_108530 [Kwoniella dejecticola CBS 10117]|uniref:Carboxylic ester hydrolase n=1 Tax=Kwoniella dejecticola CBS 10117 TaxID=1296121 RepID=A0A1A5ZX55_9TREE|nr:uncharacterized protein I303_07146 [Kwoniella dejecticola CBS 10117]OBR82387.1 hypothetical protein I303_07146 [Kwoniella dejecticola CBS 10117]
MKSSLNVLSVLLAIDSVLGWTSPLGPVVDLGYAVYLGNDTLPDVTFFGGIPYMQPPLGDLRWRAPVQLDESPKSDDQKYIEDARNFGPICIQQPATVGVGDEDCVTLNIWKPTNAKDGDNLPVVIYIHGGGNYYNSAQGFPMQDWVNITKGNVVAVNIQYRLGLLGFLASSEVLADGTANAGLLDQRASFDWVKRHIKSFGGDPNHITISGESSGGGSVLNHLIWQNGTADQSFNAAVLQSIGNDPFPKPETYEQCFGNVTQFVGCDQSDDVMSCLRNTSVRTLVAAVNHRPQPLCKYLPIVDGTNIVDFPSRLVANGRFSKVPIMAGHMNNDGTTFTGSPTSVTNASSLFTALTASRYTNLSNATFTKALSYYNQSDFSSFYDLAQTLVGDTQFTCLDWYLATQAAKYGQPAYLFRWNTPDPVQLAASPYKGVMHTSELYFLFDGTNSGVSSANALTIFRPFNATEQQLSNEGVSYWTSFSRAYDPSTYKYSTSPDWPTLTANGTQQRIVPQEGNSTTMTATFVEDIPEDYVNRCTFWASVGPELRI